MNPLLGPADEGGRIPARQQTRVAAFLLSAHGAQARQLATTMPMQLRAPWHIELHAQYCREMDIAVFPGALTPTEIVTAWQAGADVVKVFPAGAMGGAKYLRSLKAPLPQIEMIPTGGVTVETAQDFLSAGAFGLGVGADLMDERGLENGGVTAKAREYMQVVKSFRER